MENWENCLVHSEIGKCEVFQAWEFIHSCPTFFLNENVCFAFDSAKTGTGNGRERREGRKITAFGLIFLLHCFSVSLALTLTKKVLSLSHPSLSHTLHPPPPPRTLWLLLFIQLFQARIFIEEKFPSTFLSFYEFWKFFFPSLVTHFTHISNYSLTLPRLTITYAKFIAKNSLTLPFCLIILPFFFLFIIHHSFFIAGKSFSTNFHKTFVLFSAFQLSRSLLDRGKFSLKKFSFFVVFVPLSWCFIHLHISSFSWTSFFPWCGGDNERT